MNRVIIQGNLGGAPNYKKSKGKTPVCTFSVATRERGKKKSGELFSITEWHQVITFGKTAELCHRYLKKGDPTLIEGRIRSEKWTDKDGRNQVAFRIIADSIQFLSRRLVKDDKAVLDLSKTTDEALTGFQFD